MSLVYIKEDSSLSMEEKAVFTGHLDREGLAGNIWDLFQEWIARSTLKVRFFYLKAYRMDELIGLGLFIRIKPLDPTSSYAKLRKNPIIKKTVTFMSKQMGNCAYVSFRNLITLNITRPFFFKKPECESGVMAAMLKYLTGIKDADMVSFLDLDSEERHYRKSGFALYPSASEIFFDVTAYTDISDYLKKHKNLKKKLKRDREIVSTEIVQGAIDPALIPQLKECMTCSIGESRVNTPTQTFFEDNVFETDTFRSDSCIHILVRVEDRLVGFHTFFVSGSHMGGFIGGFKRDTSVRSYAYERVIVATLDHAIKNRLTRIHFALIDNQTKIRLIDCRESCRVYFHSRNPVNRLIFRQTFKYNDVHELYMLEKQGLMSNNP